MARTVEATIAGVVYSMPVNFAASMKVAEEPGGGDPLKLARQMANQGQMLSSAQIVGIITAGVRCAGCQLENIGDEIIDAGVQNYLPTATTYIVALVSGSPAKPGPKPKKKPS